MHRNKPNKHDTIGATVYNVYVTRLYLERFINLLLASY